MYIKRNYLKVSYNFIFENKETVQKYKISNIFG